MATEKLKFKIELFATHWNKIPTVEILINNDSKFSAEISETEDKPKLIEFEHEFEEEKSRYQEYAPFLHDAYTGRIEGTPAIKDSLYNILMEYEDKYDFLNPEGQKVAKDIIGRNLYSVPEIRKLYREYDSKTVSSK